MLQANYMETATDSNCLADAIIINIPTPSNDMLEVDYKTDGRLLSLDNVNTIYSRLMKEFRKGSFDPNKREMYRISQSINSAIEQVFTFEEINLLDIYEVETARRYLFDLAFSMACDIEQVGHEFEWAITKIKNSNALIRKSQIFDEHILDVLP